MKPHTIYEPRETSRQAVKQQLVQQLETGQLTPANANLWLLLRQQAALPYLFTDQRLATLTAAFTQQTADPYTATTQALVQAAGEIIQMKKFEMDSWLS
ncbi:hypothetical protein ACUIJQ_01895 [Levilactobacillus hammesii]|uniref:hypothetical protein n=1 Tax=Levilactobacillus hammesii TaxID=267633 RepID=UPI0012EEB5CF|nr:hypothetical protein [Levilactobacillus hammesii]